MEIQEQKLTAELPTLLIDRHATEVLTRAPGQKKAGYLAVPGTMEIGLTLDAKDADPSQVMVNVRLLSAHYSPPPGCSPAALKIVNQANRALADRLTDESLLAS